MTSSAAGTSSPAAEAPGRTATGRSRSARGGTWTFLTHHAHVLLVVVGSPDALVQEIAERVGITRRATLAILRDLQDAGYVLRTRHGRRTHYTVRPDVPFRHPDQAGHDIGELLGLFGRIMPEEGVGPADGKT